MKNWQNFPQKTPQFFPIFQVLKWFWKKRKRLGIEREVPPQQDGKNELLENIFEKHQFVNQKIKEKIAERTNMKPLAVRAIFSAIFGRKIDIFWLKILKN